jgi:hypothetical protein
MQPCKIDQADVLLDGLGYRFISFTEAESTVKRLQGRRGVVWTPRLRERWGARMPVTPAPPERGPRGEEVYRLPPGPEEETHG